MPLDSFSELARMRLRNQRLIGTKFAKPEDVVTWLGAVQSQDYGGAKWGLAQRMRKPNDATIEAAFEAGRLVRTHVMRPTWHFVAPADVRWLLELTAPRVRALLAYYDRKLGIDAAVRRKARKALADALRDGRYLTRDELGGVLDASGHRLAQILCHAELDAQICSGPRRGKQFTYALLDERVPSVLARPREEALADLAFRYFASHGPALVQDFAWWSGLTVADAKRGIALNDSRLREERAEDKTYWHAPSRAAKLESPLVHLLPNYDEHLGSYKDYSPMFDRERTGPKVKLEPVLSRHIAVLDGRIIGGWQRTLERDHVAIEVQLLMRLTASERDALERAADRYGEFVERSVQLKIRNASA